MEFMTGSSNSAKKVDDSIRSQAFTRYFNLVIIEIYNRTSYNMREKETDEALGLHLEYIGL
jgi:hypothetical protein